MAQAIKGFWISAKGVERRCRAGMCFDKTGYGVAADLLSEKQLGQMRADPYLTVEETEFDTDEDMTTADAGNVDGLDVQARMRHEKLLGYFFELANAGESKPTVKVVKEATGINDITAKEIAELWGEG